MMLYELDEIERAVLEGCRHGRTGYCFDCVRERHNQEALDGKYDDIDDDWASAPHPSAHCIRPGERVIKWYCSDCQCEHEASVLGGAVEDGRDEDSN